MRNVMRHFILRCFFLGDSKLQADGNVPPVVLADTKRFRRYLAVSFATLLAILLHVVVFFGYITRPASPPFSAAAPLPMIAMVLSAPPRTESGGCSTCGFTSTDETQSDQKAAAQTR